MRKEGGDDWLDEEGCVLPTGVGGSLLERLWESMSLVRAILRDLRATGRWEHADKDPAWWRYTEACWSYPEQRLKPSSEIVRIWAAENRVSSVRRSSNARILYREFSTWAGFERCATSEEEFLRQLADLGYRLQDGFVEGSCVAEDFFAALGYENGRCGCDERECLETTSRETYQHQSRQRAETRESGGTLALRSVS
jgi:hypothetical protein